MRSDLLLAPSAIEGKRTGTPGDHIVSQAGLDRFVYLPSLLVLVLQRPARTMSSFAPLSVDDLAVNTIRTLAADVVGKANSGHPVSKPRQFRCLTPCPHLSSRSKSSFLMYLFLTSGRSYGNGTGSPHPIHKVPYLLDTPLFVHILHQILMRWALRPGFLTPILRALNGSTGIVLFCRTGE